MTIYRSGWYQPDAQTTATERERLAFLHAMLEMYAAYRRLQLNNVEFTLPTNVRVEIEYQGQALRVAFHVGEGMPSRAQVSP